MNEAEISQLLTNELSKFRNIEYGTLKERIGGYMYSGDRELRDGTVCKITIGPLWEINEIPEFHRDGAIAVIANIKGRGILVDSRATHRFLVLPTGDIIDE